MADDGAIVFDSDGGIGAAGEKLRPTPGHSAHRGANFPGQQVPGGYLEPGSESFYNVRSIVMTGELGTEVGGEGSVDGLWDVVAVGLSAPGLYGY